MKWTTHIVYTRINLKSTVILTVPNFTLSMITTELNTCEGLIFYSFVHFREHERLRERERERDTTFIFYIGSS